MIFVDFPTWTMLWFCEWGGGDGLMVGLNDLSDLSNINTSMIQWELTPRLQGIVFSVDFPAPVGWDRAVGFWSHGKPWALFGDALLSCYLSIDITSWKLLEIERESAWSCFWWILVLLLVLAPHRADVGVSVQLPSPPAVPASSCRVPLSTADVGRPLIALSCQTPLPFQEESPHSCNSAGLPFPPKGHRRGLLPYSSTLGVLKGQELTHILWFPVAGRCISIGHWSTGHSANFLFPWIFLLSLKFVQNFSVFAVLEQGVFVVWMVR